MEADEKGKEEQEYPFSKIKKNNNILVVATCVLPSLLVQSLASPPTGNFSISSLKAIKLIKLSPTAIK